MRFLKLFLYAISVTQCLFYAYRTPQFGLAMFQAQDWHIWPVATILESPVETFLGKGQAVGHVLPGSALCWQLVVLPAQAKGRRPT